jgi:hypothetical protein
MCTSTIKQHIRKLPATRLFTTRELLQYGKRSAVDQVLFRLVRQKQIVRVARGVFVRKIKYKPTLKKIAEVKAAAFGKKIYYHARNLLVDLKLVPRATKNCALFAVNAHSSSFATCRGRVELHGFGKRKLELCKTKLGNVLNSLWHLGENLCTEKIVARTINNIHTSERESLRRASALMPAWLHHLCLFKYASSLASKLA